MTQSEILYNLRQFRYEQHIGEAPLETIPKSELVVGRIYKGVCRNASEAEWMGDHFRYWRTKFGFGFWENINHFEDDNGFDVFVPIRIKGC